jgi:hypothetical protein
VQQGQQASLIVEDTCNCVALEVLTTSCCCAERRTQQQACQGVAAVHVMSACSSGSSSDAVLDAVQS